MAQQPVSITWHCTQCPQCAHVSVVSVLATVEDDKGDKSLVFVGKDSDVMQQKVVGE